MPHLPFPLRFLVSGLLVVAVHAGLLLALLAPAALRPAPPVMDVALLMEQGQPSGPASAPTLAAAPAPARARALRPAATAAPARPAIARRAPPAPDAPAASPVNSAPPLPVAPALPPGSTASAGGAGTSGSGAAPAPTPGVAPGTGANAGERGAGITPPQLDPGNPSNPRPAYPAASRRLGETGVVALRLLVTADGRVAEVRLQHSSGYDRLDQAALQTVRRWTLHPARRDGEPVAAWMPYSIKFELEK